MNTLPWVDALSVEDLPNEDVLGVMVAGRDIAVYTVSGEVYATNNLCTHGHAVLCNGFLEGHEIECPLHQGRFDVRNGQPTCEPASVALRCHPVKIEGGRVYLQLVAAAD